ncbi:trehalose-phosphatase [Neorhizobium lilium]|uniref:Trehalose 6-phosphate phosphatase n=1 Tax=Neorhizobium lilium TaxID=2503024 RepID=A0A3S3VKW2_9HYPH|nr:trehalose-phosphatase [Neorhizobium lilium]RWX76785.1 trehalose-phosphatase [Neorhizobium lilium]
MSYEPNTLQATLDTVQSGGAILYDIARDPGRWALFLDIDGTLIDIADSPDGITVPPDLPNTLEQISQLLGGALALVTGRALVYADALFGSHHFPIAGLHGAERRSSSGEVQRLERSGDFAALKERITDQARQWPGVLVEDKGLAIAAHYRQAPEYQQQVEAVMTHFAELAGPDYMLQRGKMVLEIRPSRASKGEALRAFLSEPPFQGRIPIAVGDDLTDEAMFRVANELGGHSIRIEETAAQSIATSALPSAAGLRAILGTLAQQRKQAGKDAS